MSRLTGVDLVKIIEDRVSIAYETQKASSKRCSQRISYYSGWTKTALSEYHRKSWNGLSGMGDILSGIIGGLLCQKVAPLEAAALGVYVHGKAGDCAKQTKGERALIASDVIDALPAVL